MGTDAPAPGPLKRSRSGLERLLGAAKLVDNRQFKKAGGVPATKQCAQCGKSSIVEDEKEGKEVCENCGLERAARMPTPSKQGAGAGGHAQDGPHGGGSKRGVMQAIVVQALRGQQNGDSKQPASLVQALEKIGHMCNLMGLPEDVKKSAQRMCEEAKRSGMKCVEGLAVSSVFVACELAKVPRTIKEMASVSPLTDIEIRSAVKRLRKSLNPSPVARPARAGDLVERFCSNLKEDCGLSFPVGRELMKLTREICLNAKEHNVAQSRVPESVTAAALWMAVLLCQATKGRCTRQHVSGVTGVADSTVRTAFKEMLPERHKLVPRSLASSAQIDAMLHPNA